VSRSSRTVRRGLPGAIPASPGSLPRSLSGAPFLCALAAALALCGCGGGSSASSGASPPPGASGPPTKLVGTLADTGAVTLETPAGATVTKLPSGWYTVNVRVNSTTSAFRLVGPGVHLVTKSRPGITLWGVDLQKGTYHYTSVGPAHAATHSLTVY